MTQRMKWGLWITLGLCAMAILGALAFKSGLYLATRLFDRSGMGALRQTNIVFTLHVRDESGRPVASAEASARALDEEFWNGQWVAESGGAIQIGEKEAGYFPYPKGRVRPAEWQVVVRAKGFAPAVATVNSETQSVLGVVLTGGRELALHFTTANGAPLPDGFTPNLYGDGFNILGQRSIYQHNLQAGRDIQPRKRGTMTWAEPTGEGRYVARIPDDWSTVGILVDEPGFLRAFNTGLLPVPANPGEPLEVALPEPGQLTVGITNLSSGAMPFSMYSLTIHSPVVMVEGHGRRDMAGTASSENPNNTITAPLPPGTYSVDVNAFSFNRKKGDAVPRNWNTSQNVDVQAGTTQDVRLAYTPFSPDKLKGSARAHLRINEYDGRPAAGRAYRIEVHDRESGTVPVADGRVGATGEIELEGLAPLAKESYNVLVDDQRLGYFHFKDDPAFVERTFRMPPLAGDSAPALSATDLATGEPVSLEALRGQVVYLDFWATWCGPCREPMVRANALARRHGDEWKGRVTLLAVSIDDDVETLRSTIQKRDLTALRHAWAEAGEQRGWHSDAAAAYGINSVPTALLIDREGRIVWRGHPGKEDLEEKIAKLLVSNP